MGVPETRQEQSQYFYKLFMVEYVRAQLEVLLADEGFLCDSIPEAPPRFLLPTTTTGAIYLDPVTLKRIRDPDAYLRASGGRTEMLRIEPYIVLPVDLEQFPAIRDYMEEYKRTRRVEVMDRTIRFNSYEYDKRKMLYERSQELERLIRKCDIKTLSGRERKAELEKLRLTEGVPAGLVVRPPQYLAQPRRSALSSTWRRAPR